MDKDVYYVIVKYGGEHVGDKKGIPCTSLKQAEGMAASFSKRPNLSTEIKKQK